MVSRESTWESKECKSMVDQSEDWGMEEDETLGRVI